MLGGKELTALNAQKQALVLESSVNRLKLQMDYGTLRAAAAQIAGVGRRGAPILAVLAPLAGFLLARRAKRRKPSSWIGRLSLAVKFIGPAFALWSSFRQKQEPGSGREGR